ncbi:hypothetical protein LQW54_001965 [Pestalotiopsis sp. IQ-011]
MPPLYSTTTTFSGTLQIRIPTGRMMRRDSSSSETSTETTVLPTYKPEYATYCSDADAYYSACSEAGVTASTTTLVATTTTETNTEPSCVVRRMVMAGGEAMGYEFEPGWDRHVFAGVALN